MTRLFLAIAASQKLLIINWPELLIKSALPYSGTPIGAYDLQIAAIALASNLILVTHNIREFERVDGLQVEDWEVEM